MASPPKIVVVARNNLRHDNRLAKEAASLADAGFAVVALGTVERAGDATAEETGYGSIVRVVTTPAALERRDGQGETADESRSRREAFVRTSPIGAVRGFAGRMRDAYLLYREARKLRPGLSIVHNPDTLACGWLLKSRARVPFIYDSREIWTEQLAEESRLHKTLWSWLEGALIHRADAVVVVNESVGDELVRRYGIARPVAVYNGPSECLPAGPVHRPVRLLFQGRFAADRGLVPLVRAMDRLRGRATLALQGYGGIEQELRELVKELSLEGVVEFVAPCAPAEVVKSAAGYDVGVISYAPTTLNLKLSSPNKLFDYLGGGLALASSDIIEVRRIVEAHQCGVLFDPTDEADMVSALSRLVDDVEALERMKANAPQACRDYVWPVQAERLVALVRRLAGDPA
jgi:glycosyltransferase involved in cell wall biosynthesis